MKSYRTRGRLLAPSLLASVAAAGTPLLATSLVALAPAAAAAQDYTTANLAGRVLGRDGAPVAGARVAVHSGQGSIRTAVTDAAGHFQASQLPFGAYTVDIAKAGFAAVEGQQITVGPNGASYAFTLLPQGAPVSEVVVTAAARRTPDFARTDTGLAVDVQPTAERIPLARSINAIALLAPGVVSADPTIVSHVRRAQSAVSIAGASAAENVYYVNGLNVTDPRNLLGYSDLPFDAISTIDIKTGGYQAEFGRATGGVVNIVTRSGSNEFHGGATLAYTPRDLAVHSKRAYAPGAAGVAGAVSYQDVASSEVIDPDVWFSGPLIKDRLFFFGIFNPRVTKDYLGYTSLGLTGTNQYVGVQQATRSDTPRWLAKFDLNITDTQHLEATLFSDEADLQQSFYDYDIRAGRTGVNPGYTQTVGGLNQIYHYTGEFTDWFTLSALYGDSKASQQDRGALLGIPLVIDFRNPAVVRYLTPAHVAQLTQPVGEDERETYRIDADLYLRDALGAHHIRGGWDREDLTSTDHHQFNGGYYLYVGRAAASPTGLAAIKTVVDGAGTFRATQTAYYLEDSWDVGFIPNLTLQAGVRLDVYAYRNDVGQTWFRNDDQYAPRLGFTWDPRGAGADKVYGSFGRYYLPIATNTSIREVSGEDFHQEFRLVSTTDGTVNGPIRVDANGIPILGPKLIPNVVLSSGVTPQPDQIVAQNIQPMYEDEFILGYEHQFHAEAGGALDGWKAGVRYMDRTLRSTIEDTNLGRDGALGRYCDRTHDVGCAAATTINARFQGYFILLNPGSAATINLDLANGPGGANGHTITLTQDDLLLPRARRRYQALEFTFDRPFDGKWSLGGSYVLARSKGNYEGAVKSDTGQADTSITQDFDAWFLTTGADGYLPNDRRHTFKLYGAYAVTDRFRVGGNAYAQSGRPYGCIGYFPLDPAAGPTPSAWFCNGVETPRASAGRTGWVYDVDLDLTYDLVPQTDGFGQVQAAVDVFNLFNNQGVTRVVEQGETGNLPGAPNLAYGLPRTYQAPRSVRFTVRYAF